MPRREGLPLFNFVKGCNVACRAYQLGYNTTVDCHRIAYLLSAYQRGVRMQFFAMTAFISRVLKVIPARCFSLVPSDSYAEGPKGPKRPERGKLKRFLSKRQSLLTVTNYSLLITNYFCRFCPLAPFIFLRVLKIIPALRWVVARVSK